MDIAKEIIQRGMVDIRIDSVVPCLRNSKTGEFVQTEVVHVVKSCSLRRFNTRSGWNINWGLLPKDVEIYGLRVKGEAEIQGLVGIKNDKDADAVYIHWANAAPNNNPERNNGRKDYIGVGGHLFAVASEKSVEYGHEGYIYGCASNKDVLKHYIDVFGAVHMPVQWEYQFIIDEKESRKIREVYDYEWSKDKL